MMNMTKLVGILDDLIQLLTRADEKNWLNAIKSFRNRCDEVFDEQSRSILQAELRRIFGGMGSFSDLVLYSSGQVLIKENQELDRLRKELFEVLRS